MTDDPHFRRALAKGGSPPEGRASCREFLRVGVVIDAAVGSLSMPLPGHAATPKRGGTLQIPSSKTTNLNPGIQSGTATMISGAQIFAGLVEYDGQRKLHPYLAESWETSKDHL